MTLPLVIPAKAGIHDDHEHSLPAWTPACAGVTAAAAVHGAEQ